MKFFKYLNIYKLFLFLFLFIISFDLTNNELCQYNNGEETLRQYLNGTDYIENKKKKCFALSNNFGNDKCCFDNENKICIQEYNSNNIECPLDTIVPNNCGLAGIYQPKSKEICQEISLVQGFCCYVKITLDNGTESHSCLRVKKLKKDKKAESNEIGSFVNSVVQNAKIEEECKSSKLKFYWILNFIFILFLFY